VHWLNLFAKFSVTERTAASVEGQTKYTGFIQYIWPDPQPGDLGQPISVEWNWDTWCPVTWYRRTRIKAAVSH